MESHAHEDPIQDSAVCDSSEDSSYESDSQEEGEFEIVQSSAKESNRLPMCKLSGRFAIEGSSGDVRCLATRPKAADEIYLKTQNNDAILVTSLQGGTKTKLDSDSISVEDIAVDDNGHVVVVSKSCRGVYIYDREGNVFNSFEVSSKDIDDMALETGMEITSVDIDRNRKIAIGCCVGGKGMVMIYEMDGEFKRSIRFNIRPMFISSRFLLIAVSDPERKAVEVRHNDKTGELIRTLQITDIGPRVEPCGILLTWDHLFVITKANNQNKSNEMKDTGAVHLYDTNSMAYLGAAISGLSNPREIDVTHDGTVVIADEGEIKLFKN